MYKALTVAGSDSGGGAGIQADLKTFSAFGVYGMSVLTAVTAQNTCGVFGIEELSLDIIRKQFDAVIKDIGTDAVKTGMLGNSRIVKLVADKIDNFGLSNVVVDPVMIAKSGDSLLSQEAVVQVKKLLIPLAEVITPNIPEAEILLNNKITSEQDMEQAAVELHHLGCKFVVIKGGHLSEKHNPDIQEAIDIIYDGSKIVSLRDKYILTTNTHGTGCTYASAIAASLAQGCSTLNAIKNAKIFITKAIATSTNLGKGHGPVNHLIYVNRNELY